MDLQRLAQREGATRLLEVVAEGQTAGIVALRALPYAMDARVAVGQLCLWLEHAGSPERELLLDGLHQTLASTHVPGEALDVRGHRECRRVVRGLPVKDLPDSARDQLAAISALLYP